MYTLQPENLNVNTYEDDWIQGEESGLRPSLNSYGVYFSIHVQNWFIKISVRKNKSNCCSSF